MSEQQKMITVVGRFRIAYVMVGNPDGHPDIVSTKLAQEIGVTETEDDAYFIRVTAEQQDVKEYLSRTKLYLAKQPLALEEILELKQNTVTSLNKKKGKCLGIALDIGSGAFEPIFFSVERENAEVLPVIHPYLCKILNFLIQEKAITDYEIKYLTKKKIHVMIYQPKDDVVFVYKFEDASEILTAQLIWVRWFTKFAAANYTKWSRIFFTSLYNEAEERLKRWNAWKELHTPDLYKITKEGGNDGK